ncbi:hypothetical protein [Gluconobacter oxydans]|uniref:hypothetical protein n=2 Tax=Acetobacteraceae TaxID=433 RepID=UPI0012DACEB4|nr:hypothetical protein [Gluconobacter oxydans]
MNKIVSKISFTILVLFFLAVIFIRSHQKSPTVDEFHDYLVNYVYRPIPASNAETGLQRLRRIEMLEMRQGLNPTFEITELSCQKKGILEIRYICHLSVKIKYKTSDIKSTLEIHRDDLGYIYGKEIIENQ